MVFGNSSCKPDVALDIDNIEVNPLISKFALHPPLKATIVPSENAPIDCVLNMIPSFPEVTFGGKIPPN
jgi:hypothetical protein